MDLAIKNMFGKQENRNRRDSSLIQARFSQLYCSCYKFYNILESVFSYLERVLVVDLCCCLFDVRC